MIGALLPLFVAVPLLAAAILAVVPSRAVRAAVVLTVATGVQYLLDGSRAVAPATVPPSGG